MRGERDREIGKARDREKRRERETWSGWGEGVGWRVFGEGRRRNAAGGMRGGGAAGGQSLMGKLFCCGGEGGELSEWEREGGMGEGEGGANLHFLFLH